MTDDISRIKAVLEGDKESFRELVQKYEKPVIRMINNIVNNHHNSEDIAQDVFFTAYKKIRSYDPALSSFSTWLFTIAKNKSLNALKKKRPASIDHLPQNSYLSEPSDILTQQEFLARLDRALEILPAKQKIAFVLAEFEDLPYEQIAQIEGARIGTIKSRINRAKRKLQSALIRFGKEYI